MMKNQSKVGILAWNWNFATESLSSLPCDDNGKPLVSGDYMDQNCHCHQNYSYVTQNQN